MSFTILISDVADKDLGPVLAKLKIPRGAQYELTHFLDVEIPADTAPKKKKRKQGVRRSRADMLVTKLTMSGKVARQPESAVAKGLVHFEECEAELGIGNVTVVDFRAHLERVNMKDPEGIQKRMVRDHYLNYLE